MSGSETNQKNSRLCFHFSPLRVVRLKLLQLVRTSQQLWGMTGPGACGEFSDAGYEPLFGSLAGQGADVIFQVVSGVYDGQWVNVHLRRLRIIVVCL
jgi:hypothetical protein